LINTHKYGETVLENIVSGFNTVFPGGGGDRVAVDGNPALHMGAPNKGRGNPLAPAALPKNGSVPGPNPSYATGGAGAILGLIPPNNAARDPAAKGKGSVKGKTSGGT
jgi:hypothetical protein